MSAEYEEECLSLEKYKLDEVESRSDIIGKGAYGEVLELEFRGLKCAGKKLHGVLVKNSSSEQRVDITRRFRSECSILSCLRHPNIVQFLGIHYEQGSTIPILVMEFLPMNLTHCIEQYNLPDHIAYSILHDVALGLCYLHGYKPDPVIHRDLSANNVLVTSDMTAKISDLGVARILECTPAQKLTMAPGHPAHMPPEALVSDPVYDAAIDVFSYGIVVLHIFSKKLPFPTGATVPDPQDLTKLIPRTEFERRAHYFNIMGSEHRLTEVTKKCLSNHPPHRPKAKEIVHVVRQERSRIPPVTANKLHSLQSIKLLKENNKELILRVASLEAKLEAYTTNTRRHSTLPRFERRRSGESEISDLESGFSAAGSLRSEDSDQSLASISDKGTEMAHPCQPGAKLVCSSHGPKLPVAMCNAQAVVIDNTVYVGGGSTKNKEHDDVIFTHVLESDSWDRMPPCPVTAFGIVSHSEILLVIGGCIIATKGISNEVYGYDKDSKSWNSKLPPMLTARHSLTAVSHGLDVFTCGGKHAEGVSKSVQIFKSDDFQWYTLTTPLPFRLYKMSSTIIHDTLYLLGGFDEFAFTDKVIYASLSSLLEATTHNPTKHTPWKQLANIPHNYATAANFGGCLLAIGGSRIRGSASIDMFSQLNKKWVTLVKLPWGNALLSPAVAELPDGKLLIFGGAKSNLELQTAVYRVKIVCQ